MTRPDHAPEPIGRRSDKDVGRRVMRGAALMAGARVGQRLFSLVNLVVLARLLDPRDYGIAALALSAMTLLQNLSDVRVNAALISMRDIDERHLDTGFTLTLLRGLLLAAAMLISAEWFAAFSRSPELAAPLRALAIIPVLDGLKNPCFVLYQRNIDFSPEFTRTVVSAALGTIAAIAAAIMFRSYWAIVVGAIVTRGLQSGLTWIGIPARLRLSLTDWRRFLSFGGWLTGAGILDQVRTDFAPNLLIGRYMGEGALGVYAIASRLALLFTRELAQPLNSAVTPGLAAILHDPERLRAAYRDAQSTIAGFVLPIGFGLAVMARDLITLVAGAKWVAAAPLVQILGFAFSLSLFSPVSAAIAASFERTKLLFERNLVTTVVMLPAFAYAIVAGDLRDGVLVAAAVTLLETYLSIRMAARLIGSRIAEPLTRNWRTFAAAALMAGAVALTGQSGETETLPLLAQVLPRVALGAAVYLVSLLALWRAAGRPQGFETKAIELVAPRLPPRARAGLVALTRRR